MAGLFLFLFLFATYFLPSVQDHKTQATEQLKKSIQDELKLYINAENESSLSLRQIGGITWNLACVSGYYESGLKTLRRALRPEGLNYGSLSIADEYFLDAETGLVLLSEQKKILITIPFEPHNLQRDLPLAPLERKGKSPCIQAENAYLIENKGNYSRRQFKLADKPDL